VSHPDAAVEVQDQGPVPSLARHRERAREERLVPRVVTVVQVEASCEQVRDSDTLPHTLGVHHPQDLLG